MIPFGSQRGSGQDLAIHLMNAHDNEYVELADLRGAMAADLSGAFAEWETQAHAMTRCENYLYSLSVNPDPAQGRMPRALYDDYIARVETALGLAGQPRAVVFHIKDDQWGQAREHCHVVWSRIDVQDCKAIHMAFDHDKLMTVTRRFARDHDIALAPGYHNLEDRKRQTHRQLSLYDKVQEDASGLGREERTALITELWRQRDTPAAFVQALEHHGYLLASGKRPFVLVDVYGHTNALPKLIEDKTANTKAIRAFLGDAYGVENLPTVEEAKALATRHRQALEAFRKSQARADQLDLLKEHQARRRAKLEAEIGDKLERQKWVRLERDVQHFDERRAQRSTYLGQSRAIRFERHEGRPRGLAGFLARVSGVELARAKLHKYQDKKRYDAFLLEKQQLRDRQEAERQELQRCQEMQALDLERQRRALDQTEKRERRSLEMSFQKQQRIRSRAGHEHMPSLALELAPPGRRAAPHKAMHRYTSELAREMQQARHRDVRHPPKAPETLQQHFTQAAGGQSGFTESERGSSDRAPSQTSEPNAPAQDFQRKGRDDEGGRTR